MEYKAWMRASIGKWWEGRIPQSDAERAMARWAEEAANAREANKGWKKQLGALCEKGVERDVGYIKRRRERLRAHRRWVSEKLRVIRDDLIEGKIHAEMDRRAELLFGGEVKHEAALIKEEHDASPLVAKGETFCVDDEIDVSIDID